MTLMYSVFGSLFPLQLALTDLKFVSLLILLLNVCLYRKSEKNLYCRYIQKLAIATFE
jgi:hypothetical protein